MKIFVTGATGFLGRAFCSTAVLQGHEVMALCRSHAACLPDGCETTIGALGSLKWDEIERFRPDAALHLAWIATPGLYLTSPENELLIQQSEDLFRNLSRLGISHIAGVGTCIEYGSSSAPLNEKTSPLNPEFPYSVAKVETARRLESLAEQDGFRWSWLRVFYPYGEGESAGRMPTSLMKKLTAGEVLELRTPDSIKDYIHIRDAASAMLRAMETGLAGPVNIGTGTGIRIIDLARQIARCCGARESLVQRAIDPAVDPNPVTVADMSKLGCTGWIPQVSLDEGLDRLRGSLLR